MDFTMKLEKIGWRARFKPELDKNMVRNVILTLNGFTSLESGEFQSKKMKKPSHDPNLFILK